MADEEDELIIWKTVPEFEQYRISNTGIVMRGDNKINPFVGTHGYLVFSPSKNSRQKHLLVHRVLAELFIENPDNKRYIDHIDQIKTNNNLSNLRWATQSENNYNRRGLGVCYDKTNKTHVVQIIKDGKKYTKSFPGTDEGLENAILHRRKMELVLYGEFAPQATEEEDFDVDELAELLTSLSAPKRRGGVFYDKERNKWSAKIQKGKTLTFKRFPYTDEGKIEAESFLQEQRRKLYPEEYESTKE